MPELGIGDTAAALGVSVDTIRRRMKRGELPARKTPDGRWLVIPTAGARDPSSLFRKGQDEFAALALAKFTPAFF